MGLTLCVNLMGLGFARVAYADDAPTTEVPADKASLTITKLVEGSGTPSADELFEFSLTKDGAPAAGRYSIDGADYQPIPDDGKICIKAGQTASFSDLPTGAYTVTETQPTGSTYKGTSFSVNGSDAQGGTSVTVRVTQPTSNGGWYTESGQIATDDDGYFVYAITTDQVNADGTISVDCNPLAEYMEYAMRDNQNWTPADFKVKFVNKTGVAIHYKDYEFNTVNWLSVGEAYTPSGSPSMNNTNDGRDGYGWGEAWQTFYPTLVGQTSLSAALAATGFDGNGIRIAMSPLRCINPAVVSYFNSNPGRGTLTGISSTSSAQQITLLQMNALPELIKQEFSFKNWQGETVTLPADEGRTYADFICAFYGVSSLDELTIAQKYNVLGTGYWGSPAMPYAGQSHITTYYSNLAGTIGNWCVPTAALEDGSLDYFKTWGMTDSVVAEGKSLKSGGQVFTAEDAAIYAYQQNYYLFESDPDVLKMAYEFLYERCMRLSFDTDDRAVSESIDNNSAPVEDVSGIKSYIDKTDAANENVLAAMNGGSSMADGDAITLDRMRGYIEVPNAWNQFRYYDFGFSLTFEADELPQTETVVTFTNAYEKKGDPEMPVSPPSPETPADSSKPSAPVDEKRLPATGDDGGFVVPLVLAGGALVIASWAMRRRSR